MEQFHQHALPSGIHRDATGTPLNPLIPSNGDSHTHTIDSRTLNHSHSIKIFANAEAEEKNSKNDDKGLADGRVEVAAAKSTAVGISYSNGNGNGKDVSFLGDHKDNHKGDQNGDHKDHKDHKDSPGQAIYTATAGNHNPSNPSTSTHESTSIYSQIQSQIQSNQGNHVSGTHTHSHDFSHAESKTSMNSNSIPIPMLTKKQRQAIEDEEIRNSPYWIQFTELNSLKLRLYYSPLNPISSCCLLVSGPPLEELRKPPETDLRLLNRKAAEAIGAAGRCNGIDYIIFYYRLNFLGF